MSASGGPRLLHCHSSVAREFIDSLFKDNRLIFDVTVYYSHSVLCHQILSCLLLSSKLCLFHIKKLKAEAEILINML